MAETSTPDLACLECGVKIYRTSPRGSIPRFCKACRKDRQRKSIRDYCRRKRAGIKPSPTYDCQRCEGTFPRQHMTTRPPAYCPDCRKALEADRGARRREAKYSALREKFETEGRWASCERCGTQIRCPRQKGPAPRWCDPCRNERRREREQVARPWARVGACVDCGGPTSRETAATVRPRCSKCYQAARDSDTGRWIGRVARDRRELALQYGSRAVRMQGAWNDRYMPLDIYERDRWVCQICTKRISKKLRSPHPMSASLDHVIPVSQGGTDEKANVRSAHRSCNSSRNNRGGNEQLRLIG